MTTDCAPATTARCNADFPWNEFDPEKYLADNYEDLREDDRVILTRVRDFLVEALGECRDARGIDVGTGANLYPALAMLPFCESITLYERSQSNVQWLSKQQADGWPSWRTAWHQFWDLLCTQEAYAALPVPNKELGRRVTVTEGSVFELGKGDERWDVGTMFFVAESITPQRAEFRSAVDHFLDALRPNAPFAIAFMEHSAGYQVAGTQFPATDICDNDVRGCLADRAEVVVFDHVGTGANPLRDGYSGMIVACGRVKDRTGT